MAPDEGRLRPEDISIVLAGDADRDDILRLYVEGVLDGQVRSNDSRADIEDLHAGYFSDDGASGFWVAKYASRTVGMVGVQRTSDNSAEIRRLRVQRELQRHGIGTLLMRHAMQFCKERGYLKVVLDVRIERAPAIALFEKFGFQHSRTRDVNGRKLLDFYLDLYREPGA